MANPYKDLERRSYWKTGVAAYSNELPSDLFRKKWNLLQSDKIATAGSCFAQHIGRQLEQNGFAVINAEPPPLGMPPDVCQRFGYNVYSCRYGNIYTTRQLLQLARQAIGRFTPEEYIWENSAGRFFDGMRPSVEPLGLDTEHEVVLHRVYHLKKVEEMLREMDVFVFTLGLTEGWTHLESGTTYAVAPGTIRSNYSESDFLFTNFSYAEIKQDFIDFKNLVSEVRGARPPVRYILTASPVPLTATASQSHILVANSYSKSVLRAAAGELSLDHSIEYFPSYEIITSPWSEFRNYEYNKRSVTTAAVSRVMKVFFSEFGSAERAPPTPVVEIVKHLDFSAACDEDVFCDEAMLEAFAPQ